MKKLQGKVALISGASRGVGRGIALGLAEQGAKVYLIGRTHQTEDNEEGLSGSLQKTQALVEEMGGEAFCLPCDVTDAKQISDTFSLLRTKEEKLDILVNSAWAGYEQVFSEKAYTWEHKFWEQSEDTWNRMFDTGVRACFLVGQQAARWMINERSGLIVNISYWAAQKYIANLPYSVSKTATDKVTEYMALELNEHNIAAVTLYPGTVKTERVMRGSDYIDITKCESELFVGRAVAALACDKSIMKKTGTVQLTSRLAKEYGFTDIDGSKPEILSLEQI